MHPWLDHATASLKQSIEECCHGFELLRLSKVEGVFLDIV